MSHTIPLSRAVQAATTCSHQPSDGICTQYLAACRIAGTEFGAAAFWSPSIGAFAIAEGRRVLAWAHVVNVVAGVARLTTAEYLRLRALQDQTSTPCHLIFCAEGCVALTSAGIGEVIYDLVLIDGDPWMEIEI